MALFRLRWELMGACLGCEGNLNFDPNLRTSVTGCFTEACSGYKRQCASWPHQMSVSTVRKQRLSALHVRLSPSEASSLAVLFLVRCLWRCGCILSVSCRQQPAPLPQAPQQQGEKQEQVPILTWPGKRTCRQASLMPIRAESHTSLCDGQAWLRPVTVFPETTEGRALGGQRAREGEVCEVDRLGVFPAAGIILQCYSDSH